MNPLATGNPLSPDSQAFMDLLERHLSEHDDKQRADMASPPTSAGDMSSLFPGLMASPGNGYASFGSAAAAGDNKPVQMMNSVSAATPNNAPSPNTMAALINILQVQAQAQGQPMDPQTQQRQLVSLLNNMPWSATGSANAQQLNAFAAMMVPGHNTNQSLPQTANNVVHPSQLYTQAQPANGYPYPGIDTPEHSGPGSSSARKPGRGASGTESNGNTPPATQSSAGSSPEAIASGSQRPMNPSASDATVTGATAGRGKAGVPSRQASDDVDGQHVKRKAGDEEIEGHQSHRNRRNADPGDSHEEDSEGEEHDGSPHQAGKKSTSKRTTTTSKTSRRKSTAVAGNLDAIVSKGDEDLDAKALKRKNQNRAAQKAFRERREARVKDLEDKVNELEAKNAGNEFENENLRQLLAKLQQENMALKTAAFTFSMPMPQSAAASTSPVGSAPSKSQSPETRRVDAQQRLPAPPTLPQPQPIQHRGESTSSSASGVSNTMRSSSGSVSRSPAELSAASVSPFGGARPTQVFNPEPFNAFASSTANANPSGSQAGMGSRNVSPVEQHQASTSSPMGSRGSFTQFTNPGSESLMQRVSEVSQQNVNHQNTSTSDPVNSGSNDMDWQSLLNNNFTMLAQAPEFMSFSDDAAFGNFGGYSDIWPGFSNTDFAADTAGRDVNMSGIQSTLVDPSGSTGNQFNTIHSKPSADDALMSMADDNMEEFLRSLGGGQTPAGTGTADDVFDMNFGGGSDEAFQANDMQRQYLGGLKNPSSSSLSSAPSSVLSPGNYFNTSPDASSASSVSATNSGAKHMSASPDTVASDSSSNSQAFRVGTFGSRPEDMGPGMLKKDGTVVNCDKLFEQVTSKIPINSGFDLDDLCDHFKRKAVCNGKGPQIKEEDADRILAEYAAERKLKLLQQSSNPTAKPYQ